MRPAAVSIMPDDLLKKLGPEQTRDLLTFLLTPAPSHAARLRRRREAAEAADRRGGERGAGRRAEPAGEDAADSRRAGRRAEGPRPRRARLPGVAEGVGRAARAPATRSRSMTAMEWPAKEEFQKADVMVFFQRGDWDAEARRRHRRLPRTRRRAGLHPLGRGWPEGSPGFAKRIGLAWGAGSSSATARST